MNVNNFSVSLDGPGATEFFASLPASYKNRKFKAEKTLQGVPITYHRRDTCLRFSVTTEEPTASILSIAILPSSRPGICLIEINRLSAVRHVTIVYDSSLERTCQNAIGTFFNQLVKATVPPPNPPPGILPGKISKQHRPLCGAWAG